MGKINLYRFRDRVAFHYDSEHGGTETIYLSPDMACKFSEALKRYARDIKENNFVDSLLCTTEITDKD